MIYIIEAAFLLIGLFFAYNGGRTKIDRIGWRNVFLAVIYTGGAFALMLLDMIYT